MFQMERQGEVNIYIIYISNLDANMKIDQRIGLNLNYWIKHSIPIPIPYGSLTHDFVRALSLINPFRPDDPL